MEHDTNNYLATLLTKIQPHTLTPDEQEKARRDLGGFIMGKLMRKKFRRRVSADTQEAIAKKIASSIAKNRPIHFTIPFGGYKHFWNPSHPEPDWAELFHLRWMTEYVSPILAAYKPGVIIEYITEDLIMPCMDNYPNQSLEAYAKAFRQVVDWYQRQVPENLVIRYWRVGDKYDKQAIIKKVENLLPERKTAFQKLSADEQAAEIHRSQRSMYWNGEQDLTNLTEQQKHDRIVESRLIELAFYDVEMEAEFLGDYYNGDNHITLCFSFGLSPDNDEWGDLTIQSSPGSIVDHWIGRGILQKNHGKLRHTIVSQQQYKTAKTKTEVTVNPHLLLLKNYKTIEIIGN